MKITKNDLIQFLTWTRNGISFCSCWFLILWLIFNYSFGIKNIATDNLIRMMFFIIGGVLIFSSVFTRLFFKKLLFVTRLSIFMIVFCVYECAVFYGTGFFQGSGSPALWLVFFGSILISYFVCIIIYHFYSNKKGELYTQALQAYQLKRREVNG